MLEILGRDACEHGEDVPTATRNQQKQLALQVRGFHEAKRRCLARSWPQP
jgi:hypothetical protein